MSETLATPANMRAYERRNPARHIQTPDGNGTITVEPVRCFAYSPHTGERYSATPGDYWDRPDDEPLMDEHGEPMILVTERTVYLDALTREEVNSE